MNFIYSFHSIACICCHWQWRNKCHSPAGSAAHARRVRLRTPSDEKKNVKKKKKNVGELWPGEISRLIEYTIQFAKLNIGSFMLNH